MSARPFPSVVFDLEGNTGRSAAVLLRDDVICWEIPDSVDNPVAFIKQRTEEAGFHIDFLETKHGEIAGPVTLIDTEQTIPESGLNKVKSRFYRLGRKI